jgi:hypothetical protein
MNTIRTFFRWLWKDVIEPAAVAMASDLFGKVSAWVWDKFAAGARRLYEWVQRKAGNLEAAGVPEDSIRRQVMNASVGHLRTILAKAEAARDADDIQAFANSFEGVLKDA